MSFVYARGNLKIGFSVSKKVGNSVVRHRAIRKMRHAANKLLDNIKPDHSIIFVAKEGIDKLHLDDIIKAMQNTLQRGGIHK